MSASFPMKITTENEAITPSHEKKINISEFNLYLYKRSNNEETLFNNKQARRKVNIVLSNDALMVLP